MDQDWQAAQHADECKRRAEAVEVIVKARTLGLAETECMAIAYEAGVASEVYKELRK